MLCCLQSSKLDKPVTYKSCQLVRRSAILLSMLIKCDLRVKCLIGFLVERSLKFKVTCKPIGRHSFWKTYSISRQCPLELISVRCFFQLPLVAFVACVVSSAGCYACLSVCLCVCLFVSVRPHSYSRVTGTRDDEFFAVNS